MKKSELEQLLKVKNIALVVDKLSDDEGDTFWVYRLLFYTSTNFLQMATAFHTSLTLHYLKTVSQAIVRTINDYNIDFNNVHVFNSDNIPNMKKKK